VVKNTLTRIAARDAGVEIADEALAGPSAIAFVTGDPVEAAKGLRAFAKAHPVLVVKGGVVEGRALSAAEIAKLADVESREVLLAKFAGAINASLQQAVSLFAAPLSQTARLVEALRAKVEESGDAVEVPATEPVAEDAPVAEDVAATEPVAEDAPAAEQVAEEQVADEAVSAEAGADDTTTADEAPAAAPDAEV
jgi:large subunit ribosomal protein L10